MEQLATECVYYDGYPPRPAPPLLGIKNKNISSARTVGMTFCSRGPDSSWSLTSGLRGLQNHADQLRHVKVGGVVQRPHVSPAWAEAGIGTEAEELPSEAGCRLRVTWTTENTRVMQRQWCVMEGWNDIHVSRYDITSVTRPWYDIYRDIKNKKEKLRMDRSAVDIF